MLGGRYVADRCVVFNAETVGRILDMTKSQQYGVPESKPRDTLFISRDGRTAIRCILVGQPPPHMASHSVGGRLSVSDASDAVIKSMTQFVGLNLPWGSCELIEAVVSGLDCWELVEPKPYGVS